MSFTLFLEEKISFILFQLSFVIFVSFFLGMFDFPVSIIVLFISISFLFTFFYLLFYYVKKRREVKRIMCLVDNLKEKYLISEVLKKPRTIENKGYYYALKKACKAMNDELGRISKQRSDYQEYLESFVHEIKTPLAAISLFADNTNDELIKEETLKIDNLVEQMLYYARSENPEKDFFVREVNLEEVLHQAIINHRNYMLKLGIKLNVHDLNKMVYTDEKYLLFIVSQVIDNAIKYLDKKSKKIEIYAVENEEETCLIIKDNGIGISKADIKRVFDKGFTGNDRTKSHATGMGLYLCKKICDSLNLDIRIESEEKNYTKVTITFFRK